MGLMPFLSLRPRIVDGSDAPCEGSAPEAVGSFCALPRGAQQEDYLVVIDELVPVAEGLVLVAVTL